MSRVHFHEWAIEQHRKTNHLYDKIIPYEYHLNMVVKEVHRHYEIAKNTPMTDEQHEKMPIGRLGLNVFSQLEVLVNGAWGHDLIEDTRTNYNDIIAAGGGTEVAEIIYALTDDKGKNRAERGNEEHYKRLVVVPGAAFVKFCDRIANVRYSKFAESSMYDKYKKENPDFMRKCYIPELQSFKVKETLESLFV